MRSCLVFSCLLLLAGCNLFGGTPAVPDASGTGDSGADVSTPTDMARSDVGDASFADLPDISDTSDIPDVPEMGTECVTNDECPAGEVCVLGNCRPQLSVDETCTESVDCASGLCGADRTCRELAVPVARYRVDEAEFGTAPAALRDDAADPLDLALAYENASGFRVDHDGNRYARFSGRETGATAAIANTKIEAAFDGATTGTLEVKSMSFLCGSDHRVLGMGTGGDPAEDGWFTLRESRSSDAIYVRFLANMATTEYLRTDGGCVASAPLVVHIALDTTALSSTDRVRMYADGRRIPLVPGGTGPPTLNQQLDIGQPVADRYMFVGRPNPVSGGRPTDQRIWYAAFYSDALSEAVIQRNAGQILHRDDESQGTGVVTRTVGINGDFASLQDWYDAREGDLSQRFMVAVTDSGLFTEGEVVSSPDGCRGTVVKEDRTGTRSDFLTLDGYEPGCIEGSILTGESSGVTAAFAGVLLRGTIERASIMDDGVDGATLDGSTTDADHYFAVTSASDMLHRGTPGVGASIQPAGDGLHVMQPFTRIERIRIASTAAGSAGLRIDAPDVLVRHTLVEASNSDAIVIDGDRAVIEDSIVFNATGDGIRHVAGDGVVLRNLTIVGAGGTALRSVGNAVAQNVIANGATGFAADAPWATASHNISTDGTAPGQNSQTDVAVESLFVSLTPGAEDLRLAPMSPAVNAGTDTGVVSWDIDLETRSGTWDIGADEQ